MGALKDTKSDFRALFRHVVASQRLRRPFALMAMGFAGLAVLRTLMVPPATPGIATHLVLAASVTMLAINLYCHRPFFPIPVWRLRLSLGGLALVSGTLLYRSRCWLAALCDVSEIKQQKATFGLLGTDTMTILALLLLAQLLLRRYSRLGVSCAFAACAGLISAFIAISYDHPMYSEQMSVATFVAMLPLTLGALTLYARQPYVRALLLSGATGLRTRLSILVGFGIPWLCGLVLHRNFGVPERGVPIEELSFAAAALSACTVAIVTGYQHEKVERDSRQLRRELAQHVTQDVLTQTLNRASITQELRLRWARFCECGPEQCVIALDLDHFKSVNDRFGHDAGDRILSRIHDALRPHLRRSDAVGRWGGEAFLILIEDVSPEDASHLTERLRKAVTSLAPVQRGNFCEMKLHSAVTASFGVAFFGEEDRSQDDAVKRAGVALHKAKNGGRNRVCLEHLPPISPHAA